jgi:adenylate cyclase
VDEQWGGGTGVLEAERLADGGPADRVSRGARDTTPATRPPGATRRLSAIMFTDMVGYTKLVQEDERGARRDRDRWRSMLDRHARGHGGRTLHFYGDGALTVFDSAVAAVESAVAIQRDLLEEPRVLLRTGIHTGDVVYDDQGVLGDGVNVAARIQRLATPGAVLASGKVFDEIKNQPHLSAVSLGEFHLKNVQRPVRVYAMAADGISLPSAHALPDRSSRAPESIAVLPFVSMSVDPADEVFSDGMTEELINLLTRVDGLQVTARTSSFAFKGRQEDIREIAKTLGVRMVLEGSVRRVANRVRVTAQLIDATSGYHLLSETYDRLVSDAFELQDEIARKIVDAVQARLDALRPSAETNAGPARARRR